MEANELRIGNWFGSRWISEPERIDYFQVKSIKENEDWSMVEPIPLTPEILEKAGFELRDGIYNNGRGNSILIDLVHFHVKMAFVGIAPIIATNIQHLHQLQNLYFALTGEELNVKL